MRELEKKNASFTKAGLTDIAGLDAGAHHNLQ